LTNECGGYVPRTSWSLQWSSGFVIIGSAEIFSAEAAFPNTATDAARMFHEPWPACKAFAEREDRATESHVNSRDSWPSRLHVTD